MRKKRKTAEPKEVAKVVIKRECDEPMARAKHLLPCDGGAKCFNCVACIETDTIGHREHHNLNHWRGAPMDGGLW